MCSPHLARRRFLSITGLAGASVLLGRSALADVMSPAPRSLSFLNPHTAETVSAVYWESGGFVPDGLAAIDRVLRDHRTGEVIAVDRGLLDLLHTVRKELGANGPFHVISCYR